MDREHFTQFLRDKGLKVTNQRIGVQFTGPYSFCWSYS